MSASDSHRAEVRIVLEALLNKDRTTDVYGRNEKVIMEDGNLDSQSPLIDEIMALLDSERERWIGEVKSRIPKKKPIARLVDGEYRGLMELGEINNDEAHWRSGANEALDAVSKVLDSCNG